MLGSIKLPLNGGEGWLMLSKLEGMEGLLIVCSVQDFVELVFLYILVDSMLQSPSSHPPTLLCQLLHIVLQHSP